jgi:hypothetical protein
MLLAAGCWQLASGNWLLANGNWLLAFPFNPLLPFQFKSNILLELYFFITNAFSSKV